MADFSFRWKNSGGNLPPVQPNFVVPQAAASQQQTVGYSPAATPATPGPDDINAKKEKLATLKARLATIDSKIAELKATAPNDEKAIAAKLTEIGDTSLYQGILAREQNAAAQNNANVSSLENMLYDAEKLTWGLKSKNAEDREMVRSNIAATLRRAEDMAGRQGVDLSNNESYQRLKAAMAEGAEASSVYEGEEKFANTLWSKSKSGNLRDADIEEAKAWIEAHPDSQFSAKVIQVVENYAPKTAEAKARYAKRKNAARSLHSDLSDLPKDELARRARNLTASERQLLEDFYPEFLK